MCVIRIRFFFSRVRLVDSIGDKYYLIRSREIASWIISRIDTIIIMVSLLPS